MPGKYRYEYGCDVVGVNEERFDCSRSCGYKMSDGKCGMLKQIKIEDGEIKAPKTKPGMAKKEEHNGKNGEKKRG